MDPIELWQDCDCWFVRAYDTITRFTTREEAEDYYAEYATKGTPCDE